MACTFRSQSDVGRLERELAPIRIRNRRPVWQARGLEALSKRAFDDTLVTQTSLSLLTFVCLQEVTLIVRLLTYTMQ